MPRKSGSWLAAPVSERDHIRGPATAAVTLVEYGDFECRYCGAAYPVVNALEAHVGARMRLVYRHFPLERIHPHAKLAAEAAEAAGAQGKFWEMHARLFEHQLELQGEDLVRHAADLRLDLDQFALELAKHTHAERVATDFISGVRSGVNGTPTFFINDLRYDGPHGFESLMLAVEQASSPSSQPPTLRGRRVG